jgi:acetyl-CoA acetyltransferase
MTKRIGRGACIVGIGETEYTKWGGTDESEYQLACRAILTAVADAGLEIDDIDGFTSFSDERSGPIPLAGDLGVRELRFASMTSIPGGGGACAAVIEAAMAVDTGQAEAVVVYRSLCQGQFGRMGRMIGRTSGPADPVPVLREAANDAEALQAFSTPFGIMGPAIMFALRIRRHMELFGTTSEHLGHVAVTLRDHANRNPRATMSDRLLTLEDHQSSRVVADPYRLYDCCLETDGACALVVTTEARAADSAKRGAVILASAQGAGAGHLLGSALSNSGAFAHEYATGGGSSVARRLWAQAGVGPGDVDVAQLYDNFTGQVLLGLEDFGFCEPGASGPFVAGGGLRRQGALPTNTAGGNLSEAYMQGLNHVIEGVRQLRGESTCQVDACELCLVTSSPGIPTSAVLLARR